MRITRPTIPPTDKITGTKMFEDPRSFAEFGFLGVVGIYVGIFVDGSTLGSVVGDTDGDVDVGIFVDVDVGIFVDVDVGIFVDVDVGILVGSVWVK